MLEPLKNGLFSPQEDLYGSDDQPPPEARPLDFDNDDFWDAFLSDDELEPLPERGDFWSEES